MNTVVLFDNLNSKLMHYLNGRSEVRLTKIPLNHTPKKAAI